jgi:hypothetical protein
MAEKREIYLQSLTDYNNGRLDVGKWYDIDDYESGDELLGDFQKRMNEKGKEIGDGEIREEWAVHDCSNVPDCSEWMGTTEIDELIQEGKYAKELGMPLSVFSEHRADRGYESAEETYDAIEDCGYDVIDGGSDRDLAYGLEEQFGSLNEMMGDRLINYFNYDKFGYDLRMDLNYIDEDEATEEWDNLDKEEKDNWSDFYDWYNDTYPDNYYGNIDDDYELGELYIDEVYGGEIPQETAEQYVDYERLGSYLSMDYSSPIEDGEGNYYYFRNC